MTKTLKDFKPDYVLIDGSSYLYRAFYALPPLTNSSGKPTGAIYGVMNMIRRLIKDFEQSHIAVIFDPKGKTFRDDMFAEYKANRPPMPDDLRSQVEPLMQLIRACGLPLIIVDGYEADDVIGTIAEVAKSQGKHTLISTGDKDMAQIVCPQITLINTMTNKIMDEDGVVEKFGVRADQIIDYLALVGDSVDNIPGIPKCGPKTAVKWLNEYDNIDTLIEHKDDIKGKIGENLRNNIEQLALSRELTTIKLDVDLPFALDELKLGGGDKPAQIELYKTLEFKTWLAEALGDESQAEMESATQEARYEMITSTKALDALVKDCIKAGTFALDTETDSLHANLANCVGISIAYQSHHAAYIPIAHRNIQEKIDTDGQDNLKMPESNIKQLSLETVLKHMAPLLSDPKLTLIGQNLKYDINVLHRQNVEIKTRCLDTMLESYVINPSSSRHDMDTLSLKYLGHKTTTFEEIAGKGAKQITFDQVDLKTATHYAAEDADITLRLHHHLYPEIESDEGLSQIFHDIEMKLMPLLAKIERTGVLIDKEKLLKQSTTMAKQIKKLEKEAYDIVGHEFNLASTKQLQAILFEEMELPVVSKTPKGQPSTAESVLQELAHEFELPKLILEHRSLSKLKSTYTDKLPTQINPETGRVHTSYHQAVTSTGRLSSSDPNLQNIPVRTEEGRRIRQAFIAREGCKIAALDYSQIELRIMAHITDDPGLNKAFQNGWDVHTATASEVFDVELDDVSPLQRRQAKAINFGLLYGMSAYGLAKQLEISRAEAENYIQTYFSRYPRIQDYMHDIREKAHEQGYVSTLFGRRLYLPEINSKNGLRRKAAERAAINAPLQGSAADIIKRAMITIDDMLSQHKNEAWMIMQVHDELVFEIKEDKVDMIVPKIAQKMQEAAELKVTLVAHAGIGDNWDEAH